LLCYTGARMMSIHRTCVIPRRRCSCGAGLHRLVRLHDLEVGFGCLHRQHSCGNVPTHSVFKGMNTITTLLPFNYIDRSWEKVCRKFFVFCCEPQQPYPATTVSIKPTKMMNLAPAMPLHPAKVTRHTG
jgi:hypothetical protein